MSVFSPSISLPQVHLGSAGSKDPGALWDLRGGKDHKAEMASWDQWDPQVNTCML